MRHLLTAVFGVLLASSANAGDQLSIEVNAAQTTPAGCNLSFLVENNLEQDVSSAVFETVFLDTSGQVFQLSLFDFGHLPINRTRVRQFLMADTACDAIGHILFNGATTCEGDGIEPRACEAALSISSRTDIEVSG